MQYDVRGVMTTEVLLICSTEQREKTCQMEDRRDRDLRLFNVEPRQIRQLACEGPSFGEHAKL